MGAAHGQLTAAAGGRRHAGRLWVAFALLAGFMVVEALAAWLTGSVALFSDASHMATDVLGIGMALAAIYAAARAGGGKPHRTFGLYRLEVFAALANAVLLSAVAIVVLAEAVGRFGDPPEVRGGPMLVVAVAGLVVNLVTFGLLRRAAGENLNVRGAYLEVLGDLLSSAGVIVAAGIILVTDWWYADPLIAVAVACLILPRTWSLGRAAVPGVRDVHDLHVWTLTSGMEVASAHLTIDRADQLGEVLACARTALQERYGITHATLQVEPAGTGRCTPVGW